MIGSTSWGHWELCCSDECGLAFRGSEKRAHLELSRARRALDKAEDLVTHWEMLVRGHEIATHNVQGNRSG